MIRVAPPSPERDLLDRLRSAAAGFARGVEIAAEPWTPPDQTGRGVDADLAIDVSWSGGTAPFVAAIARRGSPREVDSAAMRALRAARRLEADSNEIALPMVVAPFMTDAVLDQLAADDVSGLDLCGNGVIIAPGSMLLRTTGRPNKFKPSGPARFAYRGTTSLVARAFLLRTSFDSVGAIREYIAERGVEVALSTVSKGLARLEDDLLVGRERGTIFAPALGEIIDRLVETYRPPRILKRERITWEGPLATIFAAANNPGRPVLSGASSYARYTTGARGDLPVVYCEDISAVREALGRRWSADDRFGSLVIEETDDPTVQFDTREFDGVRTASPIQTLVELWNSDKRDRQMSGYVRDYILRESEAARG